MEENKKVSGSSMIISIIVLIIVLVVVVALVFVFLTDKGADIPEVEEGTTDMNDPEGNVQLDVSPDADSSDKTCTLNGKTYNEGDKYKNDCNTCECVNGGNVCTAMGCN